MEDIDTSSKTVHRVKEITLDDLEVQMQKLRDAHAAGTLCGYVLMTSIEVKTEEQEGEVVETCVACVSTSAASLLQGMEQLAEETLMPLAKRHAMAAVLTGLREFAKDLRKERAAPTGAGAPAGEAPSADSGTPPATPPAS